MSQPLVEGPAWPFARMPFGPGPGKFRGETGLGSRTGWACLRIRTTDAAVDGDTLNSIAKKLSLTHGTAEPEPDRHTFISRAEDGFLVAGISLETHAEGNYYSIVVVQSIGDSSATAAAKILTVEIAAELFGLKEKPHFSDEGSEKFWGALSTIL